MAKDCIYVIDVFNLMFQVFHAIPPMTGTQGQPTNAVFGFTRDIFAILDRQPTHLLCAFDSPGEGRRNELYAPYKANRDEMPDDLRPQIPLLKQLLEGFEIPCVQVEGWEADDVIATVTRQATEQGIDVVIVSGDKDTRQLISPSVRILNNRKGTFLDEAGLLDDWGIRPEQVIDYQALVGDSVDNVPGVPLVGPKKAKALLEQFGTLDDVLANADKAPGKKLSQNLVEFADLARISRDLVTLRTDLPLQINFESARVSEPNRPALRDLFTLLGFRRYAGMMQDSPGNDTLHEPQHSVTVLSTPAAFEQTAELWTTSRDVFLSATFAPSNPRHRRCTSIAFAFDSSQTWYVPFSESDSASAALELCVLRRIAEFPGTVITDDAKPLLQTLLRQQLTDVPSVRDLSVVDYLLDAGARAHDLRDVAARRAAPNPLDAVDSAAGKPQQQSLFDDAGTETAAAARADARLQATQIIDPEMLSALKEDNLLALYEDLERPLISILARMEFTGITVDVSELRTQSQQAKIRADELTDEIYELAGRQFNIDSPKQLSEILFTELGLPVIKKTKTGASTDQEVLETLAAMHPLPERIVERRHLTKLRGTYLDALPRLVDRETGRIHAGFHQTVAATGRLSSSDPNLQNIPIRTPEGRRIRRAFTAGEDGWTLLCADYSQIELRILAHFSGDAAMSHAFREGQDIHTAVAAEVFHVAPSEVSSDQRRTAKAVNFGVIYGQSAFGLAAALGIEKSEAAAFIESYFERYPGVAAFCEQVLTDTLRTGFARTILNRRRAISGIRNTSGIQRNMPERTAVNTVIQGSAADLIKRAMIDVDSALQTSALRARLLMQIHDELVLEVHESDVAALRILVVEKMQSAMKFTVPLVVDVTTGRNWLDQDKRI
ncbi:MAG: DNA polymerase I [Planctomycetaceae bacterium]